MKAQNQNVSDVNNSSINNSGGSVHQPQTITSLEIAQISEKNHKDLLRSIRNQEVAWEKINGRKFTLVKNKAAKGELRPMYKLTQAESLYISSKFNDEIRAKLVSRWLKLEIEKSNLPPKNEIPKLNYLEIGGFIDARDSPLRSEAFKGFTLRYFFINNIRLDVIADIKRAYQTSNKNYSLARLLNKKIKMAIKVKGFDGRIYWCVDKKGREILEAHLDYKSSVRQLKLSL